MNVRPAAELVSRALDAPGGRGGAGPVTGGVPVLWPHQQDAARAAVVHLASSARCQVVMACGTGKTRVGAEVSRRLAPDGKVLVVVPTQELLAQTADAYAAQLGAGAGRIAAVCAERAGTVVAGEIRGELAGLRGGVSTDPADVAAWLRAPGRATVLTTYASLPAIRAAHDLPGVPGWDLAVVDEAHRAAGRAGRAWLAINDDAAIPAAGRLYMTATPRLMPGESGDVVSMDDEKVFGPEVFRVSFAQAISQGLLADYRVAVAVVTSAEVAALTAGHRIVSPAGPAVPARMLAAQIALLKAAAQHDLRRIITYHHRVAGARRFAETLLNAAGLLPAAERSRPIRAGSVDGSMHLADRREVLRHLETPGDRTVVVANSRVLSEGVDVPDLDAVMFCDPRDSGTDVVQSVGRALRRGSRESKTATIIIPVLLDQAETAEAALESSEFATVWRVVRALRAHDERMASWLDQARISRAAGSGPGSVPDVPAWLTVTGAPVGPSFAAALQVRIVGAGTSPWLDGYARAAAFHAGHGHLRVPAGYAAADGYPLGRWLHEQRHQRRKGAVAADRVAQLDAIAMIWDVSEGPWLDGLARLHAFRDARGHLDIPESYQDNDGFALGRWTAWLRGRRTAGTLSQDKIDILDELGLPWRVRDHRWTRGLQAATEYHAVHGHINVPRGYTAPDGFRLDTWIRTQRRNLAEGTLDHRQAAALEALGTRREADRRWTRGLQAATEYHAVHGHINVPGSHPPVHGIDLAQWVADKRHRYRTGDLPPDRAAALEQLGIIWHPRDSAWNDGLQALREFMSTHGHTDVPQGHITPSGYRLGKWWSLQRAARNQDRLAPERTAALEALGARWDTPKDRNRTAMIAALRDFTATSGHADVPGRYVTADGLKLGAWFAEARQLIHDGRHPHPNTLAALKECGVPWAAAPADDPGQAAAGDGR